MSTENLLITNRKKIRQAWGKTDSDTEEDINIIKNWLKNQKHLPEIPSDNMIEFFLTNCKYSIEKTKQNLDMYYTIRDLMPHIYRGIHPCKSIEVQPAHTTASIVYLPKLTPELYRILLIQYNDIDSEEANILKLVAHCLNNVYEVRIHEDLAMGDVILVDFKFIKFGYMVQFTPILLKNSAQILEKVQSNRMKALHLLNPPAYIDTVINMFKGFLPKKLQKRIFTHNSLEDLYKHVPQELLPRDYGGDEKSISELQELWNKKFDQYKDRFDKLEVMTVNEDLRPEKLENDEILGYHGNFKKIGLD